MIITWEKLAVVVAVAVPVFLFISAIVYWIISCLEKTSRKADPESLYPNVFFDEVFSSSDEKNQIEIKELQKEIVALQRPLNSAAQGSISHSTRNLEKKYGECLLNYLVQFQDSKKKEVLQLTNKIELGHKTIEKEKDAYSIDNGESAVSFIFNRQNHLTDILLTGIFIPILLKILDWDIKGINDFMTTLGENPMICTATVLLVSIVSYRLMKYFKNKCSMLRDQRQRILYDKAELMLCVFECALKNVKDKIAV